MNSIHDMGGMTCFGPVVQEKDEPLFHAPWEQRVFAMTMLGMGRLDTLDAFRHAIERMDPAHYLESSYYEHWLAALETLAVEHGIVTPEELATGVLQTSSVSPDPPLPPEAVPIVVSKGAACDRPAGRRKPRFGVGDTVIAKNLNPPGHTRLPRYVRGKQGVIHLVHGTFVYPDTNAHGGGERPQPLYNVRFGARELWGPTSARGDHLYIDLWEDYLEPASSLTPKAKAAKAAKKVSAGAAKGARVKPTTSARSRRRRKAVDREQKGKKSGRTR
jgi:nitrile hydratase subunit beta